MRRTSIYLWDKQLVLISTFLLQEYPPITGVSYIEQFSVPIDDQKLEELIKRSLKCSKITSNVFPFTKTVQKHFNVKRWQTAIYGKKLIEIIEDENKYQVFPTRKEKDAYSFRQPIEVDRQHQVGLLAEAVWQAVDLSSTDEDELINVSFSHEMNWIVVKSQKSKAIANSLPYFVWPKKITWGAGIDIVYAQKSSIFISPPMDGWIFIIGLETGRDLVQTEKILIKLSEKFGEAQAFGTYNTYHWISAKKGTIIRSFIMLRDKAEVIKDVGQKKGIEEKLPWDQIKINWVPNSDIICAIATDWSLNTMLLPIDIANKGYHAAVEIKT